MPWKESKVQDERLSFVIAAISRERSMSELCRKAGITRPTGYEWVARYQANGVAGLSDKSRRPGRSPQRTGAEIEQKIAQLRHQRPDWGARKLAYLLQESGTLIPAATVHRVLLRLDLVRLEDRRTIASKRFAYEFPNQLWQMDFKSPKGWGDGVGPLSVLDDASRYVVGLYGDASSRGEWVQQRLASTFEAHGMPEAMLMDHGCPWWNQQSFGGWTKLTVWLMKQNIRLYFSGVRHPQTQGKVERFHGALEMARRRRGLPKPAERQGWLDEFRHEYNHIRPHEALGMKTPASIWYPSARGYDPNPPAWQYPEGAEVRMLENTGQLLTDGRRWQVAGPLAGEPVQLLRVEKRILVFYRKTLIRELNLKSGRQGKDGAGAALENASRFPLSPATAAAAVNPEKV